MSRLAVLAFIPLVAACTSPQKACETAALKDLRTIDALIAETEQNIARGYGVEVETVRSPNFRYCFGSRSGGRTSVGIVLCNDTYDRRVERPVALDLAEEEAKLASLKARRPATAERAAKGVAACRDYHAKG